MSTYKKDEEQQGFYYPGYEKSDAVKQAEALLQQHTSSQPAAYSSKYQTQINDTVSQLTNRQPFQYDANADALYQQYKDRYIHNGQRAMQDTMGQAAALTGGYGSSYAQNVGQQAYNEYMQGLNDVIPELYQLALDKYDRETARLQDQYTLYSDLDAQDYSRWQDQQTEYYTELDRLTEDARYKAEQDYSRYASGYDTAYTQYQQNAALATKQAETENAPLNKYKFAGVDENGQYRYYQDDKQVTYAQGINPHTGTKNKDVQYGTFGESGYQPNNIGGDKLTKTGAIATVNGHQQNVWMKSDGSLWVWDDTVNKYVEHGQFVEVDTAGTRSFKGSVMTQREFSRTKGQENRAASYNEYLENTLDKWLTEKKLNKTEVATLMVYYGLA